tara:strand:+ start:622 stop:990 length:369 start_codon:yes stop_codon:yes gene_type:complete
MNIIDFKDAEYINLVTYKKDNTPVTTPVWVAYHADSLVITSSMNAGKVKRIKNNGKASIYITNQTGTKKMSESLGLKGSLVIDPVRKAEAISSIKKKYGLISNMFMRGPDENRAIIKLDELK